MYFCDGHVIEPYVDAAYLTSVKLYPDTFEQNGDAEQRNWTIFDRIQTILIDVGLPLFLFAEALNYIIYTKNRHSTSALTNTTPYEVCFNKKPDISRHCPFSCKAYVYDHSPKCKQLSPHAYEGIFVGYADMQKAIGYTYQAKAG